LQIEKTENLPNNICQNCVQRLENSISLKADFLESSKVFEEYLVVPGTQKPSELEDTGENLENFDESTNDEKQNFEFMEPLDIKEETVELPLIVSPEKQEKKMMRPTRCFLCDCEFDSTPEIHFELNHKEIRKMNCQSCDFETHYPWFMNLHLEIHKTSEKLCENCGKSIKSTSFSSHVAHCTRNKEGMKRFICKYCQKAYHKNYLLKVHERSHSGENPYSCSECHESFPKRILLRTHNMLIHNAEPEFRCEYCFKGFIVRNRLLSHQASCQKHKIYQNT
jgi:hypothetical protein